MTTPPAHPSRLNITPAPGVVTIPRSTTSIPTAHNPAATADTNICPLGRESLATQTVSFSFFPECLFLRNVPNAQPYSAAMGALKFSPIIPRIPLTLMINCSATAKPPYFNQATIENQSSVQT
jgi:hypothetical protein